MTPQAATLIGLTAILMWSLLAVMTVATGKIPAFQLAAMTFAIGALTWIGRTGGRRVLRLGHRHEARRYPRARRRVLCDTAALDRS